MSSHDVLMLLLGAYLTLTVMAVLQFGTEVLNARRDRKAAAETEGAR